MKVIVHPNYAAFEAEIARLPETFDTQGELLHSGRNTVKRFVRADGNWVVKRYKRPNLVQRIAYTFFKPGKAERAYRYAWMLLEKGISTPEGIAYIEIKKGGLIEDCYFVSTECTDIPLYPELVDTPDYDRALADTLAVFIVHLHSLGILHGDLNLNNILYRVADGGQLHFTLIDTNRSHFKAILSSKECLENLKRVTHRRDLLKYIIGKYAELRGWNPDVCVHFVLEALKRFEKRREWKRRLFGKAGRAGIKRNF